MLWSKFIHGAKYTSTYPVIISPASLPRSELWCFKQAFSRLKSICKAAVWKTPQNFLHIHLWQSGWPAILVRTSACYLSFHESSLTVAPTGYGIQRVSTSLKSCRLKKLKLHQLCQCNYILENNQVVFIQPFRFFKIIFISNWLVDYTHEINYHFTKLYFIFYCIWFLWYIYYKLLYILCCFPKRKLVKKKLYKECLKVC